LKIQSYSSKVIPVLAAEAYRRIEMVE